MALKMGSTGQAIEAGGAGGASSHNDLDDVTPNQHHNQSHSQGDHTGDIIPDADQAFTGKLTITKGAAGDPTLAVQVTGDTFARHTLEAGGLLAWGSGAAAGDIDLARDGIGALAVQSVPNGQVTMLKIRPTTGTAPANGQENTKLALMNNEGPNEEYLLIRVLKNSQYEILSVKSGAGVLRPIVFKMDSTEAFRILTDGKTKFSQPLEIVEGAAPDPPPGNSVYLYAKDKAGVSTLYYKKDDGTEIEIAPGGATTFLGLTDTPAAYATHTLKSVRVNAGETALEFYDHEGAPDPHTGYVLESAHGGTTPAGHHPRSHAIESGSDHTTAGGTDGHFLRQTSATAFAWEADYYTVNFIIDGGGAVITAGVKGDVELPSAGVIEEWRLLADTSGNIDIQVWKDTFINFPPTGADQILNPTISGTDKNEAVGLSQAVVAKDILRFNVAALATNIKRCTVALRVRKT